MIYSIEDQINNDKTPAKEKNSIKNKTIKKLTIQKIKIEIIPIFLLVENLMNFVR
jgi:hypothetical protein